MKINLQAVNFPATDHLVQYLEDKLGKLENYYDQIISIDVYMKLDNSNEVNNKHAEFRVFIPGEDIFVTKVGQSFEECIDLGSDVIKRQVIKKKEKSSI